MRTLTAIAAAGFAVAILPGVGAAQDDRYGPAAAPGEYASATSGPVGAPVYNGPYLSWTSKSTPTQSGAAPTEVATQDTPPPERLRGPQSFLTAAVHQHHPGDSAPGYVASNTSPETPAMAAPPFRRAPVVLQSDPAPAPPAPPPVAVAAPKPAPPALVVATPKRKHRSPILAVAKPAPNAAPPAMAAATVAPPKAPPVAPPPAPLAAAPPPAPQPQAVAEVAPPDAPPPGTTGGRFYSVDRDYGLAPDPVPPPQDRAMVLIGPADNGPQTASSDSDSDAGDSDKGDSDKGDADKAGGGD